MTTPKRLRDQCAYYGHAVHTDALEAADRIEQLEAAVRKGCEYLHDFQWYGISIDESKYIREYLAEMAKLLGSAMQRGNAE